MKRDITLLLAAAVALAACERSSQSAPAAVGAEAPGPKKSIRSKKNFIHTRYEYVDSSGASLIVQNSFPKSGIKYADPSGRKHVYAVFWTRIINKTAKPLELRLNPSLDSIEVPTSSGNYMRLLLPPDTMTFAKESLFDYGLAIKPFLDKNYRKASSLQRVVKPHQASAFYVVPLSARGVGGPLRTGLSLKGKSLFYKVNGKETNFGKIN